MRESFIFYRSWLEAIKNLPREMQGDVLTAIIEYGLQGETTASLKPITKAMLAMVKPQIDVNNQRFENGCKGGRRSAKSNQTETKVEPNDNQTETKVEPNDNQTETKPKPKSNQTETKVEPNVNDNVNDNIKESLTDVRDEKKAAADAATRTEKRQEKFYESLLPYLKQYPPDMLRAFFDYWTEPNKSRTKMRFELEKTWELGRRLATWAKREKMNENKTNKTADTEQRIIQTGVAGINYFETMREQDLAARIPRDMAGHTEDIQP